VLLGTSGRLQVREQAGPLAGVEVGRERGEGEAEVAGEVAQLAGAERRDQAAAQRHRRALEQARQQGVRAVPAGVRQQRRPAAGGHQQAGGDRGRRPEAGRLQPPGDLQAPAEPGADQVGGGRAAARPAPRRLPLHQQVGTLQRDQRVGQQPPQQRGGHAERQVGHHPERPARQGDAAGVAGDDPDVAESGEPRGRARRQPWVALDRQHPPGPPGQRLGQQAGPGAELDHQVGAADLRAFGELLSEPAAGQEVLAEPFPAARARAPGHGPAP
jgi:hypothetical protein